MKSDKLGETVECSARSVSSSELRVSSSELRVSSSELRVSSSTQKILIVDDRRENLVAIRMVLDDVGAEIIEATSGNEALEATLDHDFAVAILDVMMPGMGGYELAKHLRGDDKTKVIPIVFVTASFADERQMFEGYEAGCVDYIVKPFDAQVLLGKVRIFLELDRYREELRQHRDRLEVLVRERTGALTQRINQLQCLYAVSSLVAAPFESIDETLRAAVALIPAGLQDPETSCARITFGGRAFSTANFRETPWSFGADLPISSSEVRAPDTVLVCSLEERPERGEGAFLEEERHLVSAIARQLGVLMECKRAEHDRRASETRFRRLFESAKDGILILDADAGRIIDVNPFLTELTGYSREHFLGKYLREIGLFADIVASKSAFADLQAKHYVRYEDLSLQAEDGRRIEVEFTSNVYRVDGQNVVQCNIRDITARKQAEVNRAKLEEQLRASQKMEAIGSLAGGVAHDFNNLLTVILTYTGFAIEELPEGDPLRNDLVEVNEAAERAAVLTRQLLAFGRKQVLQPVPLNLNQIATAVEKMLRRILSEDIDFVQALAPDLGLTLADPGQLEQVLMNLVVNARDAMPEGGKLTIETANVELDDEYAARHVAVTPGHYILLAITDTGCGMNEQTKARLFEPFFTTKEKGKGTGLGLSTVYGIVKQSGGNIWVYSEPGHGTTFRVYLPRELSAATATVVKPLMAPRHWTGTETILVVEDEEALRKVAKRGLEAAGYSVLIASGGSDALLTSAQHAGEIHLLLTDVVMPQMSGMTLAQELAKMRPGLKVVYMSGYADQAIVHRGVLDAGTHFLGKPFTAVGLSRKVREVLDGGGS